MRLLLIEDDTVLGAAVRDQIVADGHSVDWAQRLDAATDAMTVRPLTSSSSTSCCPMAGASRSCANCARAVT